MDELKKLLRFAPKWASASPSTWRTADRLLRIRFTLEILRSACPRLNRSALSGIESLSGAALTKLKEGDLADAERISDWEERIQRYFSEHRFSPPFTLHSPGWWISLAMVEMQPVANPR